MTVLNVFQSKMSVSEWKCGSSILIAFWYVFDYYLRLQITNASGHSTSQHSRHTVLNSSIRRTMPDRIRSRPTAHRTHRQPKCSAAPAHSHCLRRFYHARTVAECKYPFPTFIAYFTSALCETRDVIARSFEVIAHLWAGTAHRPTIGNNVTLDPIFNFQVTFWFLFVHFRSPLYTTGCVIYILLYHITQFGEEWAALLIELCSASY